MNKKITKLLVLLAVLALLCVGYAAVCILNAQKANSEEPVDTLEISENSSTVVLKVDYENATYLSYTYDNNKDGVAEEIVFSLASDNETWHWEEDSDIPISSASVPAILAKISSVTTNTVLKEVSEESFENYGLNSPTKCVTVKDTTNGTQKITFGVYNSYNAMYYAYVNDDTDTVYMLDSTVFDAFEQSVEGCIEFEVLPKIEDEQGLVSLEYSDGEREVICTYVTTDADGKKVDGRWYRSVNGGELTAIPESISDSLTRLLSGMDYLTCMTVYEEKLPDFGFEKNGDNVTGKATMKVNYRTSSKVITDAENNTVETVWTDTSKEFRLGNLHDKYDYFYANPDNTDIVCILGGSAYYKVFCLSDEELIAAGEASSSSAATTAAETDIRTQTK